MTRTQKILGLAGALTVLSAGAAFAAEKCCCEKMKSDGAMDYNMPVPAPTPAPTPEPAPVPAPTEPGLKTG